MRASLLTLLLLITTAAHSQTAEADHAAANLDFQRARALYRTAIDHDPDLKQRDRAAIRLANIEWRLDHDAAAAERDLARVNDLSEQASEASIERARIAAELREDFGAAAAAAKQAVSVAKNEVDRGRAAYFHASAVIEPVRRARLAGRCQNDGASIAPAKLEIEAVVEKGGPRPAPARLLLDAALLANDGPAAFAAWRGYYGPTGESSLLAPAGAALRAALSTWHSADVPATQRRAVGFALADSRFFTEAALVLRDPCAKEPVDDARVTEIVAYDTATRAFAKKVNEYYRNVALGRAKTADLQTIVDESARSLWKELSWTGKPSDFSQPALVDALSRMFGAYVSVGTTGNKFDVHFAHRVLDEQRDVTQYGRTASLRFIALDSIVSNGFWSWVSDGRSGDGGWATATAVYQVRPLYASGPYDMWLKITDPASRAQSDRDILDESRRDEERITEEPAILPTGVVSRLRRQYVERVLRDLDALELTGTARRDAFVARVTSDEFESSIWAHEGRHAIDKKYGLVRAGDSAELEFRAKLSEIAFAPAPRAEIGALAYRSPASTPHGAANRRVGELLTHWMNAHAKSIEGLDIAKPMLLQVDKLTDDQLREAFRSMDPLAQSR